jgi:hypothetical protein
MVWVTLLEYVKVTKVGLELVQASGVVGCNGSCRLPMQYPGLLDLCLERINNGTKLDLPLIGQLYCWSPVLHTRAPCGTQCMRTKVSLLVLYNHVLRVLCSITVQ